MLFPDAVRILRKQANATRQRSIVKAAAWRLMGSLDTFLLGYIVTGQPRYGAFIAGAEVFTKVALYYIHERAWAHIDWGMPR